MTGYDLSRAWFNFSFENPEKINPIHTAIFFFAIEHCNRLGWKAKFGFPTQMVIDALGIKKPQTYIKYFNDLVNWGFFILVQKSYNQHSANIISFNSAMPKNGKALDRAIIKHSAKHTVKQTEPTRQSKSPINKPLTNKPLTIKQTTTEPEIIFINNEEKKLFKIEECLKIALRDPRWTIANKTNIQELEEFNVKLVEESIYEIFPLDYKTWFARWKRKGKTNNFFKINNEDAINGQKIKDAQSLRILNS